MRPVGEGRRASAPEARTDLAAAVVVGSLAALTVLFSLRLDVPGSVYTAPGLFPAFIGATLFAMAVALGWRAVRGGAKNVPGVLRWQRWVRRFGWRRALRWLRKLGWRDALRCVRACRRLGTVFGTALSGMDGATGRATARLGSLSPWPSKSAALEARRTALLMALVTAYVLLVGLINFEFGLQLGFFTARVSSFEVFSVVMVTWILKLFWRAHPARCLLVALLSVEILASIFRYGFGIPMPAGY